MKKKRTMTEEHKAAIAEANRNPTPEVRAKRSASAKAAWARLGDSYRPELSEAAKKRRNKKMSLAKLGKKRKPFTPEHIANMKAALAKRHAKARAERTAADMEKPVKCWNHT